MNSQREVIASAIASPSKTNPHRENDHASGASDDDDASVKMDAGSARCPCIRQRQTDACEIAVRRVIDDLSTGISFSGSIGQR
jgi:hypothetical protein